MLELKGKYSSAIIYNDEVEQAAISQIYDLLNCKAFEDQKIRIMPDVHKGSGCVIGFTSTYTDKIVPNLVGVDISCGISSVKLGKIKDLQFEHLDKFIRQNIPSGMTVRAKPHKMSEELDLDTLSEVSNRTINKLDYVLASVGTLGGGNHFIELDLDVQGNFWITVHTGSRNFGLRIAEYYQSLAKKNMQHLPGTMNGLEYLEGDLMEEYIESTKVAHEFAVLNRKVILRSIVEDFFKERWSKLEKVETLHNYIDTKNSMIRKGAVSAYKGENLIIPWNMRDGIIIAEGLGNEDWNCSAAHGAGRTMGRGEAKRSLKMEDFKTSMNGIWTSCISTSTIDESPMVYKDPEKILNYMNGNTINVIHSMKPVYNFKASDEK